MSHEDHDDGTAYYFDESGIQFTEEGLRHFTKSERDQLTELHQQRAMKFDEICCHMGQFGPEDALSDETKAAIADEAEEMTERWDEEVEMADDPARAKEVVTKDPILRNLLANHHEIGERITDIHDSAIARDDEAA